MSIFEAIFNVLPQSENLEFVLNMKDVKIDTFKSSDASGQHVDTTDSTTIDDIKSAMLASIVIVPYAS